jgi:hypothetical protein
LRLLGIQAVFIGAVRFALWRAAARAMDSTTAQPRTAGALHRLCVRFEVAEHRAAFWNE